MQDRVAEGMVIVAELSKSLDARKIKPDDRVEARTTMDLLAHGKVLIPRNAKIVGHVTQAKSPSRPSPGATIGIAFDRVSVKGQRDIALQAVIQAMGRPLVRAVPADTGSASDPGMIPPASSSSRTDDIMRGMPLPSRGSNYPGDAGASSPDAGTPPRDSASALDPNSHGVKNLKGLSLKNEGATTLVLSEKGNVHLDSGTQLVLRTQ